MNKNFWTIIGKRRSKGFFIVVAVNAALAAALIMWFLPQKAQSEMTLAQTEQQKLDLQNQIVELPKKYEKMQQNEEAYEALRLHGFFMQQDRIAFRQLLNDLRTSSGVRLVSYDIKPQLIVANQALSNTDKQLLSSDVEVRLKGLTDLEMRSFVHTLQQSIPGLNTITEQSFTRFDELNDENLIKLGNGDPVDFVESAYKFKWYTIYDKPDPLGIQTPDGSAPPAGGAVPGVPVAPAVDPAAVAPIPPVTTDPATGGQ